MAKRIGIRVRLDERTAKRVGSHLKKLRTQKPERCKEIILDWASFIEARAKEIVPKLTRNLMNSIIFELYKDGFAAEIGPWADYGAYVEFGTRRMSARWKER